MFHTHRQSAAFTLLLVAMMSAVTACQDSLARGPTTAVSVVSSLPVFA